MVLHTVCWFCVWFGFVCLRLVYVWIAVYVCLFAFTLVTFTFTFTWVHTHCTHTHSLHTTFLVRFGLRLGWVTHPTHTHVYTHYICSFGSLLFPHGLVTVWLHFILVRLVYNTQFGLRLVVHTGLRLVPDFGLHLRLHTGWLVTHGLVTVPVRCYGYRSVYYRLLHTVGLVAPRGLRFTLVTVWVTRLRFPHTHTVTHGVWDWFTLPVYLRTVYAFYHTRFTRPYTTCHTTLHPSCHRVTTFATLHHTVCGFTLVHSLHLVGHTPLHTVWLLFWLRLHTLHTVYTHTRLVYRLVPTHTLRSGSRLVWFTVYTHSHLVHVLHTLVRTHTHTLWFTRTRTHTVYPHVWLHTFGLRFTFTVGSHFGSHGLRLRGTYRVYRLRFAHVHPHTHTRLRFGSTHYTHTVLHTPLVFVLFTHSLHWVPYTPHTPHHFAPYTPGSWLVPL